MLRQARSYGSKEWNQLDTITTRGRAGAFLDHTHSERCLRLRFGS